MTLSVANGGITNPMLAENSLDSGKIADGTIVAADLANAAVTKDQLAASGGSTDQAVKLSGGTLAWGAAEQGGISLPYNGSGSSASPLYRVNNSGSGQAVFGEATTLGPAVQGSATTGGAGEGTAIKSTSAVVSGSNRGSGPGVGGSNAAGSFGHLDTPPPGVSGSTNKTKTHRGFGGSTNLGTSG